MSHMHHEAGAPPVRASDAERDAAAEVLRAGFAAGRLTRTELDERLTAAYAARSRADLQGLTGDLPGAVPGAVTAYDRLPAAVHAWHAPEPVPAAVPCCSRSRRPGSPTRSTGS